MLKFESVSLRDAFETRQLFWRVFTEFDRAAGRTSGFAILVQHQQPHCAKVSISYNRISNQPPHIIRTTTTNMSNSVQDPTATAAQAEDAPQQLEKGKGKAVQEVAMDDDDEDDEESAEEVSYAVCN